MAQRYRSHNNHDNHGVKRTSETNEPSVQSKSIKPLPDSYTTVPPISLTDNINPATSDEQAIPTSNNIDEDELHTHWLTTVNAVLAGSNAYDDEINKDISWSAYFASMKK